MENFILRKIQWKLLVLLNYKLIATENYRFDSIESDNLV